MMTNTRTGVLSLAIISIYVGLLASSLLLTAPRSVLELVCVERVLVSLPACLPAFRIVHFDVLLSCGPFETSSPSSLQGLASSLKPLPALFNTFSTR